MQKLDSNYNDRGEEASVSGEFAKINRKLESLRRKVNELIDWIFRHNNPPEWLHQELMKQIAERIAEEVERNIKKDKD